MSSYNYAIVSGVIKKIPLVLYNQVGEPTAHLKVFLKKITEKDYPYSGDPWQDQNLTEESVLVVCHGELAEWAERSLDGGDLIVCEGFLKTVKWKDGTKKFHREYAVSADSIRLIEKKFVSLP